LKGVPRAFHFNREPNVGGDVGATEELGDSVEGVEVLVIYNAEIPTGAAVGDVQVLVLASFQRVLGQHQSQQPRRQGHRQGQGNRNFPHWKLVVVRLHEMD
jgi:hypothetical protein